MEVPKLTGQCLNRRVVWRKCSTSVANCWFDCIVTFYQGKISDVVFLYSAGIFTSDIAYWKILFVLFYAQAQVWAESHKKPGQFTGQRALTALSKVEHNTGIQAWAKKVRVPISITFALYHFSSLLSEESLEMKPFHHT